MAKRTKETSANRKRRKRRSPEEIIADLHEEILRVRARQKAKELKQSPAHRAALAALRSMDKALSAAAENGETGLRHALADGRKALAAYLEKLGVRVPKANLPKGPRPRE